MINVVKLLDNPVQLVFTGGVNPKGAYSGATAYATGDSVSYLGSSYVAIQSTTGHLPTDTTYWQILANKGDQGIQGIQGETGEQGEIGLSNTLTIGTVEKDVEPSATITGESPNQVLNLVLPQGDQGVQGVAGDEIELQKSDTHIQWRYVGAAEWTDLVLLSDLKGDQGIQGVAGFTWRSGSAVPDNAVGVNGDFYFRTTTNDIYLRSGGTYSIITNITGEQGIQGIQGNPGVDGADGADGVGVPPGGTTGQVLKKKSNTDYDTEFGDLVAVSVTSKGDLQTHNGTNPIRLPAGNNGQILESRSTETSGLKWIDPPVKSSAAETDAATDDAKFVTSLTARKLTAAPASDHLASGIKVVLNANEAQAFGDVCFINSDGQAQLGDADAIATSSCVVMCVDASISANADGNYMVLGFARDDSWNWTVGGLIYLSTTGTSGNTLTQTAPTGADDVVQVLGVAIHADRMYFNPQLNQPELT